jgi:hypothetical protein
MSLVAQVLDGLKTVRSLPKASIGLMAAKTADNHEFYQNLVKRFYSQATSRHKRFPLIRNLQYGIALYPLPEQADTYFDAIEASARRNVRKAQRLGYSFARIDFNEHRAEIAAIIRSAPVRQGPMPEHMLVDEVKPIADPVSRTTFHDYFYVGVFRENELRAYGACMVAGELFAINDIYGHAAYQADGVVPLMLVEMVRYARAHYPQARYCMYDKYFGASETLRRFKKKFLFLPYKVDWRLD